MLDAGDPFARQIVALTEAITKAISDGNANALAGCWQLPGMAVGAFGAQVFSAHKELVANCATEIQWFRARGPGQFNARIEEIFHISRDRRMVDVVWSSRPDGSATRMLYLVTRTADEGAKICGAILSDQPVGVETGTALVEAGDDLSGAISDTFPASDPIACAQPSTAGA